MNKNIRIEEEVEKTMSLLDNAEILEPNPYLYTRINARLKESGSEKVLSNKENALVIKLLPAILIVLVVFNFFSIIDFTSSNNSDTLNENRKEYIQQLGDEFLLNQSSYYPITME